MDRQNNVDAIQIMQLRRMNFNCEFTRVQVFTTDSEDADDIVFQMICKSVVSRLNVVFLI